MRMATLSAWVFQTGPFAAFQARLAHKVFQLFHFHTGRLILITPRTNDRKWGVTQLKNLMRVATLSTWGIHTGLFAAFQAHLASKILQIFYIHTGRPILITPEG